MRYIQLFENSDYNVARKQLEKLSPDALCLLDLWFYGDLIDLNNAFENKTPAAKEIWDAGQPIRDNIRNRVGDKITLYRGLVNYDLANQPENRRLYSWTSSEKIARSFAGFDEFESNKKHITRKEINAVIKKFNERGYVSFLRCKFLKTDEDIIKVYHNINKYNYPKQFDNIERAIQHYVDEHNKKVQDYKEQTLDSRIFKKRIPVNNIVWVLMYQERKGSLHENEYIVLNYSK